MEKLQIHTDYIKLDQLLKWAGVAFTGAEAKIIISEGKVKVNGNVEMQRGKKIRKGDLVEVGDRVFQVDSSV